MNKNTNVSGSASKTISSNLENKISDLNNFGTLKLLQSAENTSVCQLLGKVKSALSISNSSIVF